MPVAIRSQCGCVPTSVKAVYRDMPRYAELVTFAEDPGEAAANYYLLKLMGFPDIKVLLL